MTLAPTQAGSGELAVELVAGQSAVIAARAQTPLKILTPKTRGQSVWAYLSNFGGGLLPGDCIDFQIDIGPDARCFLGTQASTKIFRAGPKGAVINRLAARVAPGALLAYLPDVAQSFAHSCFRQTQRIDLADSTANLAFLDWYSSGRSARGERWQFAEYTSRNEIRVANKLVLLDATNLSAVDELLDLPARMGRFNCIANLTLLGAQLQPAAETLLARYSATPIRKRADILVAASPIPGGAIARIAGLSVEMVAHEILRNLDFLSPLLGDNPFERKW
jgi:urease accessory protein